MPNQTQALADALERLLARDERNTCQHQETHRGGAIWTICDDCGCKWADDKGGMPKWKDPPEWTAARKALAAHRATQQAQASESAEARDAARYRAIRDKARETRISPCRGLRGESLMDTRLKWELPVMLSWAEYCGQVSFDAAADVLVEKALAAQHKEQTP